MAPGEYQQSRAAFSLAEARRAALLVRARAGDLAEVRGQQSARRALEVAAAGGHNLLRLWTIASRSACGSSAPRAATAPSALSRTGSIATTAIPLSTLGLSHAERVWSTTSGVSCTETRGTSHGVTSYSAGSTNKAPEKKVHVLLVFQVHFSIARSMPRRPVGSGVFVVSWKEKVTLFGGDAEATC